MTSSILEGLCAKQKLERDKAINELESKLKDFDEKCIQELQMSIFSILNNQSSDWESLHGCLLALKSIITKQETISDDLINQSREISLNHLTHLEVRVRQAAGEVLGSLCTKDNGSTFVWCRSEILELVKHNLERDEILNDAAEEEQQHTKKLVEKLTSGKEQNGDSSDKLKVFHDTAGWRNLETSMKCLEHMINGSAQNFLPYIDKELLDLIFIALNHINRFVRETGYNVCSALVSTGSNESSEVNPMLVYGDELSHQLAIGLADNWSQVRLASSVAARKFLTSLPESTRERFYPVLLPRICLNRYYVAEGVRLYSQETWRQVTGTEGRLLVQKYIEQVVKYYIEATVADNHAVREAACTCIAELAIKIPSEALRPLVESLLVALKTCFNDDSWPVRDAACLACGNFINCFPEESLSSMDVLYPLFFANLKDSIPSVRQGAAAALANVVKAHGKISLEIIIKEISTSLKAIEEQPSETEKYGDLESGLTTYGVAKRLRDNDLNLHSDKQMYSCGSLAPKMGRNSGGCSDCKFRRPSQPWERCDGAIHATAELASVPVALQQVLALLPAVADSTKHRHYASHLALYDSVCKVLPVIAKGVGKKQFKPHLYRFFDVLFYSLECENALTSSSASQCLNQLSQLLGPNILRSRIEEYNPKYLKAFDANSYIAPF